MSEENIENITKSYSHFSPTFVDHHVLPNINFNGHSLINNNISVPKKVIKLCISNILNSWLRHSNTDFTWKKPLFGSVKLTKNIDPDKCKYSSHGIGFDSRSKFLFADGSFAKNVIIFGAHISSSAYIDKKVKIS